MIFYTITDTLPVVPDWSSITGDLKAGTPISIKGAVANDEAAIGLVAGDTAHGAEYAVVVTAGVVDLNAASASYGGTVSDDVVQALDNVTFIYGGRVYAVSGSSLPDYSQASDGDVLAIESGVPGWKEPSGGGAIILTRGNGNVVTGATAAEIRAAAAAGTPLYIKYGNEMRPAAFIYDEFNDRDAVRADWVELKIDYETEAQTASAKFWTVPVYESTLGTLNATFVDLASAD